MTVHNQTLDKLLITLILSQNGPDRDPTRSTAHGSDLRRRTRSTWVISTMHPVALLVKMQSRGAMVAVQTRGAETQTEYLGSQPG